MFASMDHDRTPRVSPVTLGNSRAQEERRVQSHDSPTATRAVRNANGRYANPADSSQSVKNLSNAPPVPPKALILPAESEKSPADSVWGQPQENCTRESGRRSPRRNPSATSRSNWEGNSYTPSLRTTYRRMSRDIAPGIDVPVPVNQGQIVRPF